MKKKTCPICEPILIGKAGTLFILELCESHAAAFAAGNLLPARI